MFKNKMDHLKLYEEYIGISLDLEAKKDFGFNNVHILKLHQAGLDIDVESYKFDKKIKIIKNTKVIAILQKKDDIYIVTMSKINAEFNNIDRAIDYIIENQ